MFWSTVYFLIVWVNSWWTYCTHEHIFPELASGIGVVLKKHQELKVQIALRISHYSDIGSVEAEFHRHFPICLVNQFMKITFCPHRELWATEHHSVRYATGYYLPSFFWQEIEIPNKSCTQDKLRHFISKKEVVFYWKKNKIGTELEGVW